MIVRSHFPEDLGDIGEAWQEYLQPNTSNWTVFEVPEDSRISSSMPGFLPLVQKADAHFRNRFRDKGVGPDTPLTHELQFTSGIASNSDNLLHTDNPQPGPEPTIQFGYIAGCARSAENTMWVASGAILLPPFVELGIEAANNAYALMYHGLVKAQTFWRSQHWQGPNNHLLAYELRRTLHCRPRIEYPQERKLIRNIVSARLADLA